MQVTICDVCHRGIDPVGERVYGTLNLQTAMGLGAQTIDAHRSCYELLMGLLRDQVKAELPHVWREGDPDDVTTPVDPGTVVPPPVPPSPEPAPSPAPSPAPEPTPEPTPEPAPAPEPTPEPAPAEPAPDPTVQTEG